MTEARILAAEYLVEMLGQVGWKGWLKKTFPNAVSADFADRHVEFWNWVESLKPGDKPRPFCAFWPRGGAKSTSAELAVIYLGEKKRVKKYCWYVSSTQEKADKHVESIGDKLEQIGVERALNKYGSPKGWRRERLRTAGGLTIDALGLDSGARGAKVEDQRPDLIILDDFDENEDSTQTLFKKIGLITKSILPAGSNDCAVMVIQNIIYSDSIAARLVDGRADFLANRIVSGPFPAVKNLEYESRYDENLKRSIYIITGGEATWEGQSLEVCQAQIWEWGLTAFLEEAQHDVERKGGPWAHIVFQHFTFQQKPLYVRTCVWVDPSITSTDQSDCMGISAAGIRSDGSIDGIFWWEDVTSPEDALHRAIKKAMEVKSLTVGVETDQGGDTWVSVYQRALETLKNEAKEKLAASELTEEEQQKKFKEIKWPMFASAKAGAGFGSKAERNSKMLADYEKGMVRHMIGTHNAIERALYRFPKKPLDLADSMFWAWNDLRNGVDYRKVIDSA